MLTGEPACASICISCCSIVVCRSQITECKLGQSYTNLTVKMMAQMMKKGSHVLTKLPKSTKEPVWVRDIMGIACTSVHVDLELPPPRGDTDGLICLFNRLNLNLLDFSSRTI